MRKISRLLGIMLSLIVLISVVPQNVLADENESAKYEEVTSFNTIAKDAELYVYSTIKGGTVELVAQNAVGTTFPQGSGYREYKATPNPGWIWKNWTFKQIKDENDLGNRTDNVLGTRYSFSNSGDDWRTKYDGEGMSISVNRLTSAGEVAKHKIYYSIYANFNPTVTATVNGDGGVITDPGTKEVEYGTNKTYTITAASGKIINSVEVDGVAVAVNPNTTEMNYEFPKVIEPRSIKVTFGDKEVVPEEKFIVTYTDGVDDEEIFKDQVYSDLAAGADTPKFVGEPKRENYKFLGWYPVVSDKVTGNATYTATWEKEDTTPTTPTPPTTPTTPTTPDNNQNVVADASPANTSNVNETQNNDVNSDAISTEDNNSTQSVVESPKTDELNVGLYLFIISMICGSAAIYKIIMIKKKVYDR
mgnify:CR=1 FL=1